MILRAPGRTEGCGRAWRLVALVALTTATAAVVGEAPLPVSPGEEERFAPAASACPAFSWTEAEGAVGYELAVFGARGGQLSETLVLGAELPA